jgi:hypothetical protein
VKALCAIALILLAGCGGGDSGGSSATTPRAGTLPAARDYVAMGTTNSYVGPQRTVLATDGAMVDQAEHGDTVIRLPAGRLEHLFALVAGSTRVATPKTPTNCSDCGTKYAEADGVYFKPSPAFTAEFERLRP